MRAGTLTRKMVYDRYAFFSVCEEFNTSKYMVFYDEMREAIRNAPLGSQIEICEIAMSSKSEQFGHSICTTFVCNDVFYRDYADQAYWEMMFEDYGDEMMGWI